MFLCYYLLCYLLCLCYYLLCYCLICFYLKHNNCIQQNIFKFFNKKPFAVSICLQLKTLITLFHNKSLADGTCRDITSTVNSNVFLCLHFFSFRRYASHSRLRCHPLKPVNNCGKLLWRVMLFSGKNLIRIKDIPCKIVLSSSCFFIVIQVKCNPRFQGSNSRNNPTYRPSNFRVCQWCYQKS